METIILGILILTFISYIWHIVKNYGILPSISESYYRLSDKQKKLFTFFCWGFAFPTIIIGNSFFLFLAGAGIAFVGAAAAFKSKMTNTKGYYYTVENDSKLNINDTIQFGL